MQGKKTPESEGWQQQDMVAWDSPSRIFTAFMVLFSDLLKHRFDRRVTRAATTRQLVFDYSRAADDNGAFWIDYVADIGDGYNPTYAVARQLAAEQLPFADGTGLRRGSILIMGGDQVYPAASTEDYQNRTVGPYIQAFPDGDKAACMPVGVYKHYYTMPSRCGAPEQYPALFAIPANHDWYDGLACFTRLFCQHKRIGGLQTLQRRSYFAIKLPHRWWLLAIDAQLTDDIDTPQLEYLQAAIADMQPGDSVILCMSAPAWELAPPQPQPRPQHDLLAKQDYLHIEAEICQRGAKVKLWLSGDFHYYRRYQHDGDDDDQWHKVTCGGGGAFLHPTHTRHEQFVCRANDCGDARFTERAVYPSRQRSIGIARRLWLTALDPWMAAGIRWLCLGAYFLLGWYGVHAAVEASAVAGFWPAIYRAGEWLLADRPLILLWLVLFLGICYGLVPTEFRGLRRLFSGASHWLVHLLVIGVLSGALTVWLLPAVPALVTEGVSEPIVGESVVREPALHMRYLTVFLVALGGAWLGPVVFAGYLFALVTRRGLHETLAYSMLRIQDYKSFLRLRISEDGLHAYAFKVEHVARDKRETKDAWLARLGLLRDIEPTPVEVVDEFFVPATERDPAPEGSTQTQTARGVSGGDVATGDDSASTADPVANDPGDRSMGDIASGSNTPPWSFPRAIPDKSFTAEMPASAPLGEGIDPDRDAAEIYLNAWFPDHQGAPVVLPIDRPARFHVDLGLPRDLADTAVTEALLPAALARTITETAVDVVVVCPGAEVTPPGQTLALPPPTEVAEFTIRPRIAGTLAIKVVLQVRNETIHRSHTTVRVVAPEAT